MSGKIYRIGEAAALLGLKSYVLRFWETEFPQLEPVRTDKGQRLYTEEHVELLKLIKELLHGRGLTIDGARRILNSPASLRAMQTKNDVLPSEFSSELLVSRIFPAVKGQGMLENIATNKSIKLPDSSSETSPQGHSEILTADFPDTSQPKLLSNSLGTSLHSFDCGHDEWLDEVIDDLEEIKGILLILQDIEKETYQQFKQEKE